MKQLTLFLVLVTGLLAGEGSVRLAAQHGGPVAVGTVAPSFALTLLSGETARLTDFRGKVLVLNFWASW